MESIFQELEDPGIVDLDDQVQKPVSDGQKKPKLTLDRVIYSTQMLFVNDQKVTSHLLFHHLDGYKCVSEGLNIPPEVINKQNTNIIHKNMTFLKVRKVFVEHFCVTVLSVSVCFHIS